MEGVGALPYLDVACSTVGGATGPALDVLGVPLHQHNVGLNCRSEVQRKCGGGWPARGPGHAPDGNNGKQGEHSGVLRRLPQAWYAAAGPMSRNPVA